MHVRAKACDRKFVRVQHQCAQARRRAVHHIEAGVFSIEAATNGAPHESKVLAHSLRQAVIELGSK